MPEFRFYTQSVVPSPYSAVRSPQCEFYTDRVNARLFTISYFSVRSYSFDASETGESTICPWVEVTSDEVHVMVREVKLNIFSFDLFSRKQPKYSFLLSNCTL